jgi:hypothetical protein
VCLLRLKSYHVISTYMYVDLRVMKPPLLLLLLLMMMMIMRMRMRVRVRMHNECAPSFRSTRKRVHVTHAVTRVSFF